MSDKKDKGYDASMLRFVGNLISSQNWNADYSYNAEAMVQRAVKIAKLARKELRKLQEEEGDK